MSISKPSDIRAELARLQLSQAGAAAKLGISPRQMRRYVRDGATVPPWVGLALRGLRARPRKLANADSHVYESKGEPK